MKKSSILSAMCIVVALAFLSSSAMSVSAWSKLSETTNSISTANVSGKLDVVFDQNQVFAPGALVNKVVKVENIGNIDFFARIKIDKVWGLARDEMGKLIAENLSTDNIVIDYNEKDWVYNEADGYFYYLSAIKPYEVSAPLFESFTIDGSTGGEYKNMTADITVRMEVVQAAGNGLSYWNLTQEELGIEYTEVQQTTEITTVVLQNPEKGFKFDVSDGDLFTNFKYLAAGESRSQEISVTNDWVEEAEISFYAKENAQTHISDSDRELLDKLLKEYVTITVTDEDGNVIYSGTVWGNLSSDKANPDSMAQKYSLGKFATDETKMINVILSVDQEIDNSYENLLGYVDWVFVAEVEELDESDSEIIESDSEESDTDSELESDSEEETDTTSEEESDSEEETDTTSEVESDSEEEIDTASEVESDSEEETDTTSEVESDSEEETDTTSEIESDSEEETDTTSEIESDSEEETDTTSEEESDSEEETDTASEVESDSEEETDTTSEVESDSEEETDTTSEVESDSEEETDTTSEEESDSEDETDTTSEVESDSDTDSEDETDSDSDPMSDFEDDSDTASDKTTDSEKADTSSESKSNSTPAQSTPTKTETSITQAVKTGVRMNIVLWSTTAVVSAVLFVILFKMRKKAENKSS